MGFKKKLSAGIIALTLIGASSVFAADEAAVVLDNDEKSLQFDGAATATDYSGNPAVVLQYTYTNKTAEASTAYGEYIFTVFQDGVSISTTTVSDEKYSDLSGNYLTQIKDGASISFVMSYELGSSTSPLEVEVKDISSGDEKQSFSISLEDLEGELPEKVNWEKEYKELEKKYEDLLAKYEAIGGDMDAIE